MGTIKKRVKISVEKHGSKIVAISGHYDCAGNSVDKKTQIRQIRGAAETVKSWGYDADIIKLWVNRNWEVKELDLRSKKGKGA